MTHKFLYGSAPDRHQRLGETYCLWNGRAVFLMYSEDYNFVAREADGREHMIDIRDDRFSAHPFPLGWFNQGDRAYYLSRNAYRTSKQGLVQRNLSLSSADGRDLGPLGQRIQILEALDYLVVNKYPSIPDAIRTLNGTRDREVAVSRAVAFRTDEIGIIKVAHHLDTIGWYSRAEGFCRVPDSPKALWYTKFFSELGCKIEKGIEQE